MKDLQNHVDWPQDPTLNACFASLMNKRFYKLIFEFVKLTTRSVRRVD